MTVILTAAATIALVWFVVKVLPPSITKFLMALTVIMPFTIVVVEFWPLMTWFHWIPALLSAAFEKHVRGPLIVEFGPYPKVIHFLSAGFEHIWTPLRALLGTFLNHYSVYLAAVSMIISICAFRLLWRRFLLTGQSKIEKGLIAALDKAQIELFQAESELSQAQTKFTEAQTKFTEAQSEHSRALAKLFASRAPKRPS